MCYHFDLVVLFSYCVLSIFRAGVSSSFNYLAASLHFFVCPACFFPPSCLHLVNAMRGGASWGDTRSPDSSPGAN